MYEPELGVSRRPMMFMRVDFPDPDGHMIATNSPSRMVKDTPLRACMVSPQRTYDFLILLRISMRV